MFPDDQYPYTSWGSTLLSYEATFGSYSNSKLAWRRGDTQTEVWSNSDNRFHLSETEWRRFDMELFVAGPSAGKVIFRRLDDVGATLLEDSYVDTTGKLPINFMRLRNFADPLFAFVEFVVAGKVETP